MRFKGWLALSACVALSSVASSALPCGAFVSVRAKSVPSLAVEQTLIVYDAERSLQHFVRQIVIRDPSPGFGFVVPVPEQPSVAKVKKSPFEALAKHFPVTSGLQGTSGRGGGGLAAAGATQVEVLSKERVGSFTAFVLKATDATALERWLADNQLVVPPETQAWLARYVKLDFYFAALRYEVDASKSDKGTTRAETLRITFKTPLPFYPYFEPEHASSAAAPRALAVWLVSGREHVPVSLVGSGHTAVWQRPLKEHQSRRVTPAALRGALDAELMSLLPKPDGKEPSLFVQVFEDQKRSRAGFGDIVMVPKQHAPLTSLALENSRKLMAVLDPASAP